MTINVYPEPSSSQVGYGYHIPSGTHMDFNYADNYATNGSRGFSTYSYSVPKGVYGAYCNNTNGSIYVPDGSGTSSVVGINISGTLSPAMLRVATDSTQFKIGAITNWTQSNISLGTTMFQRFTIGGENVAVTFLTFSTVSSSYRIYATTDLNTWTEQTTPGGNINPGYNAAFGSDFYQYPAAYGNGWFAVATGNANELFVSTNGFTWTTRNASMGGIVSGTVNFANGFFFATATGTGVNFFSISTDTVNWTSRSNGVDVRMNATAFGNGIYVRVGKSNVIITSTDLINWTTRAVPTNYPVGDLRAVSFGGGYFVAGGQDQEMISSTDGITWTTSRVSPGGIVRTIIYNDGVHIVGTQGSATASMAVIGTSSGGNTAGFTNFNLTISTGAGIIWTGKNYVAAASFQTGGSTQAQHAWSTSLVGKTVATLTGYFALNASTYIS